MKVKNVTDTIQAIPWLPAFLPNETREVSKDEFNHIIKNPFFIEANENKTFLDVEEKQTKKAK